jgi:hypothetical protein
VILQDFRLLVTDLKECPTRIAELIPSPVPATVGSQDSTVRGMGDVHFSPLSDGNTLHLLLFVLST